MTESEGDLLHATREAYWLEFSRLVGSTLARVPDPLRKDLLAMLQESSSVYGSCYAKFIGENEMTHYPLADDAYSTWTPIVSGRRDPEPHEQRLIDSTQRALDSGLLYSDEVKAFVKTDFAGYLRPEDATRNRSKVEGGDFGYEVYYAQKVIDVRAAAKRLADAETALALQPGMVLGSLVFSDYKLTTKCTVESVEGHDIRISGKRGAHAVTLTANALVYQAALKRAFEYGKRKSATV